MLCENASNKDDVGMLRSLTGGEMLLKWMSKHSGSRVDNFALTSRGERKAASHTCGRVN